MKKKFIFIFAPVSFAIILALETGAIALLDKYYLQEDSAYTIEKVVSSEAKATVKVAMDSGASNVRVSFDGEYVSYLKNGKIDILNLQTGEKNEISPNQGASFSYYTWIYDRNRLIIAERTGNDYFVLYYYDIAGKTKTEVYNTVDNKSIHIPLQDNSENITQIEMSTLTMCMYLRISNGSGESRVYLIDIMADKSSIHISTKHISNLVQLKKDDIVYYQNSYRDWVCKVGNLNPVSIEGNTTLRLIGSDENDDVCLAAVSGGKTDAVYLGSIAKAQFTKFSLREKVDPSAILLNQTGDIYYSSQTGKYLLNLKTGKMFLYNGKLLGLYGTGFVYVDSSGMITREALN